MARLKLKISVVRSEHRTNCVLAAVVFLIPALLCEGPGERKGRKEGAKQGRKG